VQVATMCDLAVDSAQHSIATSARTGAGLDALRGEIAVRLATIGDTSGARLAVGARHERGIAEALEALGQVDELLEGVPRGRGPEPAELVAHHLRGALDALATIGGRIEPDEVLGRIYASFCIGK
jgi:tRNA modification GTPase